MLGMLGAVIGSSFLFGPGIGAGLAEFSTRTPMFVSAGVALFGFFVAVFFLREPSRFRPPATPASPSDEGVATPAPGGDDASAAYAGVLPEQAEADAEAAKGGKGGGKAGAVAPLSPAASVPDAPFAPIIPLIVLASLLNVGATTAFFVRGG